MSLEEESIYPFYYHTDYTHINLSEIQDDWMTQSETTRTTTWRFMDNQTKHQVEKQALPNKIRNSK